MENNTPDITTSEKWEDLRSVAKQISDFLMSHPEDWFPTAELQKIVWRNRNGTISTPVSVIRRLHDLENKKMLAVAYDGIYAKYKWIPEQSRINYILARDRDRVYSNNMWTGSEPPLTNREQENTIVL